MWAPKCEHRDPKQIRTLLLSLLQKEDAICQSCLFRVVQLNPATMAPPNATETMNKPISTTKQDEKKDDDLDAIRNKKESLWKDSFQVQTTNKQAVIQMMGLDQHVVYARVVSNGNTNNDVTVSDVVHAVVDETKKRTAKDILQHHKHVSVDSVPNADTLWTLGSIWLVNETHYLQRHDAHAKRLQLSDQSLVPNWLDETVRVHTVPDTFFNADEFEWDKYSKSLLLEHSIRVVVKGEVTHVPVAGLANDKDGVIVYEVGPTQKQTYKRNKKGNFGKISRFLFCFLIVSAEQ